MISEIESKKNNDYMMRYVAFIDILGFKNMLIDDSKFKENFLSLHIFKALKEESKKFNANDKQVTIFSDSCIISYPEKNITTGRDNLFYLLTDLLFLHIDFADKDILIRGGISKGKLYHKNDVCFGTALLEAEKLENHAKYPRIIFSDDLFKDAISNENVNDIKKYGHYDDKQTKSEFYHILNKDVDGWWFIDYVRQGDEFDYGEGYMQWLEKIKNKINSIKQKETDYTIIEKFIWLENRLIYNIRNNRLVIPIDDELQVEDFRNRIKEILK